MPRVVHLAVAALLVGSAPLRADEPISVAAAISLKEAMTEIGGRYEADTGRRVEFTFGSSGQLMGQARGGAAIDVFISAANRQMDQLTADGLVRDDTRRVVAGNALVLIAPADADDPPRGFDDLPDARHGRIAIGEPAVVPAGQYAMQALTHLGIETAVADRLVYGASVRQVLDYVERGEVSAGIVYATDVIEAGGKVRVVAAADPRWHQPIVYPGAVLRASGKTGASLEFLDYLSSERATAALAGHGFVVAVPTARASDP